MGFRMDVRHTKRMRWAAKAGLRLRQEAGTEEGSLVQLEKRARAQADCGRRSRAAVLQQPRMGLNVTRQVPFPGMFPSALQKYWDSDSLPLIRHGLEMSGPTLTKMVYTSLWCLHSNLDSSHSQ